MTKRNYLLIILLISVLIKQLAWSTFIPLWQTPDEQAHFGQVQLFAETGGPKKTGNNLSKEIYTSEVLLGTNRDQFGNNKYTYHPEYNISYTNTLNGQYEEYINSLSPSSRTEYVKVESTGYPPLYYSLGALVYKLFYFSSLIDRIFAVRLLGLVIFAGLVLVSYRLGIKVFNKEHQAVSLAILVGFMPMLSFVHSGITSDTLFNLLFAYFVYLGVKLIDTGFEFKTLLKLSIVLYLAFYSKPQANIMFFILVPLLFFIAFRDKILLKIHQKSSLTIVGIIGVAGLSLLGIFQRLSSGISLFPESNNLTFSSTTFTKIIEHLFFTLKHTYSEVLPWYWGVFRWLSLGLPEILRKITNILTFLSFAGFIVFLLRLLIRHNLTKQFQMLAFCLFSLVIYFLAISTFDFTFWLSHGFSFGIQGRYFFPVLVPQMAIFLVGLTFLANNTRQLYLSKLLSTGMILMNVYVFCYLTASYYQTNSLANYLIQASQYKPLWLKYPINSLILFGFVFSACSLILIVLRQKGQTHESAIS